MDLGFLRCQPSACQSSQRKGLRHRRFRLHCQSFGGIFANFWSTLGEDCSVRNIFEGNDGGIDTTMSGLVNSSDFQNFNAPYPIITALAVNPSNGYNGCVDATGSSMQYEFHPYEFGSWEQPLRSFSLTQYMGSPLVDNGMALAPSTCLHKFDNFGFLMGASSNNLNYFLRSDSQYDPVVRTAWSGAE